MSTVESPVQEAKEFHKRRIIKLKEDLRIAQEASDVVYKEYIKVIKEAREDDIKMNELKEWTGYSRQWLRAVIEKEND